MPFGALSSAQQILIRLYLRGGPQYRAELEKSGIATKGFAASQAELARAMAVTNKRTFLHNQALFMARRGLFYATLGMVGLAAAVVKLGFEYNSMTQQAEVGFTQFLGSQVAAQQELQKLYALAALSPFEFPDIVLATRRLLPFTSGVEEANAIVQSLVDSLSSVGILTGAALTRASLAMSHLFSTGTLTGQLLYQMGRDNIPMLQALQYHFHATGEEIHNSVSERLISAGVAAKALQEYMATPQFKDVALKQATLTLQGAMSTFIDILRIGAGTGEKGLFTGLTKLLQNVDTALMPLVKAGEPVTLLLVAKAIDSQLSPSLHLVLRTFIFFSAALKSMLATFYVYFKVISMLLWPLGRLLDVFDMGGKAAKILGTAVGILTGIILVNKAVMMADAAATEVFRLRQLLLGDAIKQTTAALKLQSIVMGTQGFGGLLGKGGFLRMEGGLFKGYRAKPPPPLSKSAGLNKALVSAAEIAAAGAGAGGVGRLGKLMAKMPRDLKAVRLGVMSLIPKIMGLTVVSSALEAANIWWAWIPLIIIAVIAALVLLYRKWDWFHYLVDDTFSFIKKHWKLLMWFVPILGPIIVVILQIIDRWKGWMSFIRETIDLIKRLIDWIKKIPDKIPGSKYLKYLKYSAPILPYTLATAAYGQKGAVTNWVTSKDIGPRTPEGTFTAGGGAAVPSRETWHSWHPPIPAQSMGVNRVEPVAGLSERDRGGKERPILVQVHLDRKVLAEGVARANQDYASRR